MPHDDPSGPPPYNPGDASDSCFGGNSDDDFHTAVEDVITAVKAQQAAQDAGNTDEAKKHAATSMLHTSTMLGHLQQKMSQTLADSEAGKTS